jgi:hypothetical protein
MSELDPLNPHMRLLADVVAETYAQHAGVSLPNGTRVITADTRVEGRIVEGYVNSKGVEEYRVLFAYPKRLGVFERQTLVPLPANVDLDDFATPEG